MKPMPSYRLLLALAAGLISNPGWATDIADAPLFTTGTTVVKPNVMFVLDDSGSMAWDYLPDDADYNIPSSSGNVQYGRRAAQCNGVAYNPNPSVSYDPPLDATGTPLVNGSTSFLSGANPNSTTFNRRATSSPASLAIVGTGTINLTINASNMKDSWYPVGSIVTVFNSASSSKNYMVGTVTAWNSSSGAISIKLAFSVGSGTLSNVTVGDGAPVLQYYYSYTGTPNTAMSYTYPGNSLDTSTTFYKECNSIVGSTPGSGVFTVNFVTPSSTEAQRYANWYQYYRTRMQMMKTSASRAFAVMDSKYRVGFSTISDTGVTEGDTFLNVRDFDSTQKTSFYTKLMAANPGNSTPLRGALSKIGRYYADKISGQSYDPVQYSCQKNFTILSTDGYWNNQDETSSYGPFQINGTNVGQQDGGSTSRPQFDGNVSTSTTKNTWNVVSTYDKVTITPKTSTTSSAVTTTSYTTVNQTRTNYAAAGTYYAPVTNSTLTRCGSGTGSCKITVDTATAHNLATGNSVTISGASPSSLNGTFTITKVDNNTYTYTLASRPGSITSPGTTWSASYSSVGCGPNQAQQSAQTQTSVKTTSTPTTVTAYTDTAVQGTSQTTHYKSTTAYTETIVSVNGVQTSDNTVTGSTTNSTPVTDSAVPAPTPYPMGPVTTPNPKTVVGNATSANTTWTSSGAAVLSCVTTATAKTAGPTAAADVAGTAGTQPDQVGQPQAGGPTTANGAAVSTTTPTVATKGTVTTTTTSSSSGGSSNSLADVAQYFYATDLRNSSLGNCTGALGTNICDDNVVPVGLDNVAWQHMSTYTLSLGNSGTLKYDPGYQTQTTGDFRDIVNGAKNWPVPSSDAGAVNIDDLWHAAVNGRGRYFSATDPSSLASSLAGALSSIQAITGSASAAATSTLQPVQGDNGVFVAQFRSSEWTGDVRAYTMNVVTGEVTTSMIGADGKTVDTALWSAGDKLTTSTVRNIYYFRPSGNGATGSLQPFTYSTMSSAEKAYFDNACSKTPALSQCTGLSGTALDSVNSGANLVNFLRGQPQTQYRTPAKVLGDIVNSSPVFVGRPTMLYTENGYADFKSQKATRNATLYVGANDGMLHAFNAETTVASDGTVSVGANAGTERWAYMPNLVMSKLYMLGDSYYASKHQYFVDATPVVSDVYDGTKWRTILVGGLNAGGRGYYALDVTDPAAPVALWEFTDANMGLSFGNPLITKRADGTWVVVFTSGYNNTDGVGRLYVVNAVTGAAVITPMSTGAGTAAAPSGLNKLNAWVDSNLENLAKRFYAGDLLGNVWRFDIDNLVEPKSSAFLLASLKDANGLAQPITTVPRLGLISANGGDWPVVYVGTGEYLGKSDVSTTTQQSIYAFKDTLSATPLGDVRASGKMVKQPVTNTSPRVVGSKDTPVDWSANYGWYVDLLSSGERINVDMQLAFNNLTAAANLPGSVATDCTSAGSGTSWLYQLDISTGAGSSSAIASMVAGLSTVQLPSSQGIVIVTKVDGGIDKPVTVNPVSASNKPITRSAWRELAD